MGKSHPLAANPNSSSREGIQEGDRESGHRGGADDGGSRGRLPLHAVQVLEGSYIAVEDNNKVGEKVFEQKSSEGVTKSAKVEGEGFAQWSEARARREADELRRTAVESGGEADRSEGDRTEESKG